MCIGGERDAVIDAVDLGGVLAVSSTNTTHLPVPEVIRREPQISDRHELQDLREHEAFQKCTKFAAIRILVIASVSGACLG
jgi:hypothetical protein